MKEIAMFFPPLMMILLGVAIGMYILSKIKKNEKEKTKQQKSKIYGQKGVK